MKTFSRIEELMDYVSDHENIETLDNGEVAIKDWNEDAQTLKQYRKRYGLSTSDQKAWNSQKEELTQRVADLTAKLDSAYDELAGLKEVNCGDEQEMLQKLNAEIVAVKADNKRLETQVAEIPNLKRKIEAWNSSRILAAVKKAAADLHVPQNIIDDPDFEMIVVSDFTIEEDGYVHVKGDYSQREYGYIDAKQRDRPHWQPKSNSDSDDDDGRIPADQIAIANLYSQSESSRKYIPSIDRDDRVSDDLAAIAALFG